MSGIFLSYRRDDASGWAGRLYEHLVREWGPDQVFIDIDAIAPGEDFREAIARTMQTCDVVMVVIGPNWITARDQAGNRRLEDEGDTHRAEVVAALAADVRVIPVLVGGATMPRVSELPEPLKDLAYRNAAVIEDRRFTSDVSALQSTLKEFAENRAYQRGNADEAVPPYKTDGRQQPEMPSRPRKSAGLDARGDGPEPSTAGAGAFLTSPTVLCVSGMLLVLVWGIIDQRDWHNEDWIMRVGAGALLVVLAGFGLRSRQWKWVVAGGLGGLLGLSLWMLRLISTHPDEIAELTSLGQDGIPNLVTFAGALLVLVAGLIGMRAHSATR